MIRDNDPPKSSTGFSVGPVLSLGFAMHESGTVFATAALGSEILYGAELADEDEIDEGLLPMLDYSDAIGAWLETERQRGSVAAIVEHFEINV